MPKNSLLPSTVLPREILDLVARGFRVFPLARPDDLSYPEKKRGKAPLINGWRRSATTNPTTIAAWSSQYHGSNWGAVTGTDSKTVVIDIDGERGRASQSDLAEKGLVFPPTFTVLTGRADGGVHMWYALPTGVCIASSTGKLGAGIDVKGGGGYAVIPPSVHSTGRPYRFVDAAAPLVALPDWVVSRLADPAPRQAQAGQKANKFRPPAWSILQEGERNDGLTRFAGAQRRRGARLPELEVELRKMNAWRCSPPLPDAEVLAIARSIAKYPVGGPDPLDEAWAEVRRERVPRGYGQLLALAKHLQLARPGLPIALPLARIGALMGCDRTQVGRWRRKAERENRIRLTESYIPHRLAHRYVLCDVPLSL